MGKKKIGRIQDAEIKKQLRNFAKKEYSEKKPLEIRVLQIKPGVVFKKGSMLPNLMIKSLIGSAYVIYLNYGNDQLKFYYFSRDGRSLGGSNFDKSEKLLKEMHGKAKTLLKLPKIEKIIGLENENKRIKERWERLAKKYSHELGIKIKNLPAISIKKNISKNTIRIGIEQDKDILHFDLEYFNTDLQDIILLRELFPIYTPTSATNETIQMISTIFALSYYDLNKYIQTIKKITIKKSINRKAVEWIQEIFLPFIRSNPENKENFAHFLVRTCMMIFKNDVFTIKNFFDLFLLWLMKYGIKRYPQFFDSKAKIFRKSWLYFEMLELFYTQSDLCENYRICMLKDRKLILIHLCSRFVIGKDSQANREFMIETIPNYLQIESALENLQFSQFNDLIPGPFFFATLYEFFQESLLYLLKSKGLIVEAKNLIEISTNQEKNIEISIENKTDWILKDVEFQADLKPTKRIILQKIDPPRLQAFAGDLKLNISIKSTDKTGKCRLSLKMSFEDPFKIHERKSILLNKIEIRIVIKKKGK